RSLNLRMQSRLLGGIAAFCLGVSPPTPAQNPRGALRGTVQDASGARIPSAKIVVDAASSLRREATSDDRGEFRIDDLPVGSCHILVSSNGFADASSDVAVDLTFVREARVTLKPSAVSQTVTVQVQASSIATQPIDAASAVHQAIVSAQDLAT